LCAGGATRPARPARHGADVEKPHCAEHDPVYILAWEDQHGHAAQLKRRAMSQIAHSILAAATAVLLAAAAATGARAADTSKLDGTVVGTIGHGRHKHKVIAPASSEEKPGRAHTPLRVVVPAIKPRAHQGGQPD
jgi:hypothetical protein